MDKRLNRLLAVLDSQIDGYRQLLAILEEEKAAVSGLDADHVNRVAHKKQDTLCHLQKLETKRLAIVAGLAAAVKLPPEELTLAGIIEQAIEPHASQLQDRRRQLIELTGAIGLLNRQNRDMYRHSLDFVRHALGLLNQAGTLPEYHPDGRMRDTGSGGRMVCSDV